MTNVLIGLLLFVNTIISLLLIVVVLMQRSKNEGLGATFGAGAMDTAFGADTTNVLKKFTTWMAMAFFVVTLALGWLVAHRHSNTAVSVERLNELHERVKARKAEEAKKAGEAPVQPVQGVPVPGTSTQPAKP